jgi:non-ribosomal peptide synthetase component E (peptide arylation enzyme)
VAEAAVIGLPNPRTGEHACAVVVARDRDAPPSLRELCDHLVTSGLSDRKLPEQLEIVEQLPRNAMEKVLKADLRRRFNPS